MSKKLSLYGLVEALFQFLSIHKQITITAILALNVWVLWLSFLGINDAFSYLVSNWKIAVTMIFGSAIAGATSVGGGAVAFPVFTKLLHISPYDAKVFSLAIQSVGMGTASIVIWFTHSRVERQVILWSSIGGALGISGGLFFLAPILPPDAIKMSFSMLLASFAITLFALNSRIKHRYSIIDFWSFKSRGIFLLAGLLGGIISSLTGNGIDIVTFSVMVLLFRVCEKVATHTSVVLMAINALVGFMLQVFVFHNFSESVQSYWLAAIPLVVVGAPFGTMLCSFLRRKTVVNILIVIIFIEVATSILLIPLREIVIYFSLVTLALFSFLNYLMYRTNFSSSQLEKL